MSTSAAWVDAQVLLGIDIAIQSAGWIAALIWLRRLLRRGEARDPLARVELTDDGPGLGLLLLGFLITLYAPILTLRVAGFTADDLSRAGSDPWHRATLVADVARVAGAIALCLLLRKHPIVRSPHRPRSPAGWVLASVVAAWLITPVCVVQLLAGRAVWNWLRPDAEPPVHLALQALESSEWGRWGAVHLFVTAVVVAPVVEEVLFRGLLLPVLARGLRRFWAPTVLSGICFGLIHMSQPQDVLPLCTLGILLGYLRLRYASLALCVAVHAVFNARTMVFVLLNPDLIRMEW